MVSCSLRLYTGNALRSCYKIGFVLRKFIAWLLLIILIYLFFIHLIGISTLAGRKSMLKLADRLTTGFFSCVSSYHHRSWQKLSKGNEEIRFMSRKNINEQGEPQGLIACAVLSTALPISPLTLFEFLRDESRRCDVCFFTQISSNFKEKHKITLHCWWFVSFL